ncbi:hypothetical protein [Amycolatopsis antarctica]|uniref:hypothetical protein n=1 Tax=Amycolatopsis antarctica TaxID=1854586 RepID=UPI001056D973|nr:hypothetical protein [Amycolatopsis antarctica]
MTGERHIVVAAEPPDRAIAMDSITHANGEYGPGDVLIGASFAGIVAVQFAARYRPKAVIAHDCGIGLDGAGVNGLWFLDGAGIPAAAIDSASARIADGVDMWDRGVISVANHWARLLGVGPGMPVRDAVAGFFAWDGVPWADEAPREHRSVVGSAGGRPIVAVDSIRFALPEDRGAVVCVGSHGGRTAAAYALEIMPAGFISSDGGVGRDDSGINGLAILGEAGIAAAAVSVASARIGEGNSTYQDGVISFVNEIARERGVRAGDPARSAAKAMANGATVR